MCESSRRTATPRHLQPLRQSSTLLRNPLLMARRQSDLRPCRAVRAKLVSRQNIIDAAASRAGASCYPVAEEIMPGRADFLAEGIRTSDRRGAACASSPAAGSCSAASSTPFPRGSLAGGCGSASTRIGSSLSSPQTHLLTPLRGRPEPGRGGRSRQAVDCRHARRADPTRLTRRGHAPPSPELGTRSSRDCPRRKPATPRRAEAERADRIRYIEHVGRVELTDLARRHAQVLERDVHEMMTFNVLGLKGTFDR